MSIPLEHDYIGIALSDPNSSSTSSNVLTNNNVLNLKETELRLGLPGSDSPGLGYSSSLKNFVSGAKRGFSDAIIDGSGKWVLSGKGESEVDLTGFPSSPPPKPVEEKKASPANAPAAKAQVVGWPPIRSFRKNTMATNVSKNSDSVEKNSGSGCLYVKVSMDGAPYLRKVDLKTYCNYAQLSSALEKMFTCFTIGQCTSHGLPGREGFTASRLMDLLNGSEYVLTYEDKDGDWMLVGDVPWDMFTDSCKRLRIMKGSEAIGLAPRAMEKCKNRN